MHLPGSAPSNERLALWRADPDPGPATSPLTWAGITCHECPEREVMPPRRTR